MRWPLLQPRRSRARTFTNRPSGWGVDQAAVAPPLSFLSANARVSVKTSGGGGGTPAPGVLNCSMLLPLVIRPLLSTPTTVTLYCGGHQRPRVTTQRPLQARRFLPRASLTKVSGVRPGKMPIVVLLLNTSGLQLEQFALLTVNVYCREAQQSHT